MRADRESAIIVRGGMQGEEDGGIVRDESGSRRCEWREGALGWRVCLCVLFRAAFLSICLMDDSDDTATLRA